MIRMNHKGVRTDNENLYLDGGPTAVPGKSSLTSRQRKAGMVVISMKLCGEGTVNHEDRRAVVCLPSGTPVAIAPRRLQKPRGVDEGIEKLNLALA
jgi:hypothetical protein